MVLRILQDSLFFLRKFFTSISDTEESDKELSGEKQKGLEPDPVMTVNSANPDQEEEQDPDLMIMFDEITEREEVQGSETEEPPVRPQPTYFR